ncbi:hypothetical protein [Streptomyces sp. NPDC093093]|uniref:hypothetical protein n=1 Tax=Streptomyces sp. NPDC093093 TaxID=3366025 RepID=UPI00380FA863
MAGSDKRKGRPWGAIRPANPAAGKLATFLRAQVEASGKTLAVLEKEIQYSTTQISSLLGGRIPSQAFVTALIEATVPAQLRERRQSDAAGLLYEAMHPPRTTPASGHRPAAATGVGAGVLDVAAVQAQQIETYDRLTRALEQQAELRQAADNSARLVWVLLGMIHKLNDRVHSLTRERDHATREVVEGAQAKLARAQAQQAKAESELKRAEEKKQQAEALSSRLQEQITALTEELDRLRGGPAVQERLPDLVPFPQGGETSVDPEADDIDAALARVSAVNDTDDDTVSRITTELGDTPPTLVPDNPPISEDVPNKTADQLRVEAIAAQERGDFQEGGRLFGLLATASADFLGPYHPDTLDARHGNAYGIGEGGDTDTARDLYAALVSDCERVLGPDHPDTRRCLGAERNVGLVIDVLQKVEVGEAFSPHAQLLAGYADVLRELLFRVVSAAPDRCGRKRRSRPHRRTILITSPVQQQKLSKRQRADVFTEIPCCPPPATQRSPRSGERRSPRLRTVSLLCHDEYSLRLTNNRI